MYKMPSERKRVLRKTAKTNWLKDNKALNGQPTNTLLTTKWLERSACEELGNYVEIMGD
jgi:hypothetical protein